MERLRLRPALEHGFSVLKKERFTSLVAPLNRASIRVIERLGLRLDGRIQLLGDDLLSDSIDRESFEQPGLTRELSLPCQA